MVNLIELPINPIETAEDTPFLAHYFPTIFAEVLGPLIIELIIDIQMCEMSTEQIIARLQCALNVLLSA